MIVIYATHDKNYTRYIRGKEIDVSGITKNLSLVLLNKTNSH